MNYSPVIIATLNRREHLKRCLDSLDNNTGADKTEVYVSVDFPPSEKYQDGYKEVLDFLNHAQYGFKKLHIFFQEKNLGPVKNFEFLQNLVRVDNESFIFSEDDNEFSPNFLQYINKGLELFKDDKNVIAVCGYKDTEWEFDGNAFAQAKLFPAYGYGAWFAKDDVVSKEGTDILLSKENMKLCNMMQLYRRNKCIFYQYITQVICSAKSLFWKDGKLWWCDSMKSMYMHFTDKTVIVPFVAKSRTWGNDGSGENMPDMMSAGVFELPQLDEKEDFEYGDLNVQAFEETNYRLGDEYLRRCVSIKGLCVAWMEYGLLVLCAYNRDKAIGIIDKIKRVAKKGRQ